MSTSTIHPVETMLTLLAAMLGYPGMVFRIHSGEQLSTDRMVTRADASTGGQAKRDGVRQNTFTLDATRVAYSSHAELCGEIHLCHLVDIQEDDERYGKGDSVRHGFPRGAGRGNQSNLRRDLREVGCKVKGDRDLGITITADNVPEGAAELIDETRSVWGASRPVKDGAELTAKEDGERMRKRADARAKRREAAKAKADAGLTNLTIKDASQKSVDAFDKLAEKSGMTRAELFDAMVTLCQRIGLPETEATDETDEKAA